jgi:hypothetical protein
MLYDYIGTWTRGPQHVIRLNTNIQIVKSLKFSVKTGPIYKKKCKNIKMLKYQDEWAFVSTYHGLGGPPIFVAC